MVITRPAPTEYAPYYDTYIKKVTGNDLMAALQDNLEQMSAFIQSIPIDKGDYRYVEGKWTVKEVLMHLNDAERIFAYRALAFARGDKNSLPGFNENEYVPNCDAANRTLFNIHDEFLTIRKATLSLYKSFGDEAGNRRGVASNNKITVRALGFIIVGHCIHHVNVLKERYL